MNAWLKLTVLLLSLVTALSACDLLNPPQPVDPQTLNAENDLVTFARTALPEVRTGAELVVHVEVVAKVDLELLAVSEEVPAGFTVVQGQTTAFLTNVVAGEALELDYTLKAGTKKGNFALLGFTRAKPADEDSVSLELVSPLKVR